LGKVVSRAQQARLDYQQKQGKPVSIQDVAKAIGVTRAALSNLEARKTEQISFKLLADLCKFYGVQVGDLLEYEPDRSTHLLAAA
jgi:DNA-binding Xre family transcriptional regulator